MRSRHDRADVLGRLGHLAAVVAGIRALLAASEATDRDDELAAAEALLGRLAADIGALAEDVDRASIRARVSRPQRG